ncbi:NAD(P)-binding protein, partial [Klebsiella pneumoniae]|uniref:NAD(P)-binding protein n=1 Tax=Klebsiella pneumoniae TaxID=573 RepID=UPI003EE3B163
MAALTAAHELTSSQGWQDEYDVTLLQLGWRAGGKTTTGRGKNARIEEHGIHILQGWYDNTFRLLADVYDERREMHLDPESPY